MARSGTSITMDRDVLKWIDERVKERVFSSRSHALEYAVRELMKRVVIRVRPRLAMQALSFNIT